MKEINNRVILFLDSEVHPFAEFETPVRFELDTRKLTDGLHTLKVVSKSVLGKEGVRIIQFTVRNGPDIIVDGIKENEFVDGVVPLMINAYDKGDLKNFVIKGSETPKSVPNWLWVILVLFAGWAAYYLITYFNLNDTL
jgi:hypothetical protein